MRKPLFFMSALPLVWVLLSPAIHAKIYERNRYVKITVPSREAWVYDDEFNQFPPARENPRTSAEYFPDDQPFWVLGVEVDVVVRRPDGTLTVKSDDDAYARMVHHCNFIYVDGLKPYQLPYGTGGELTNLRLPKPYAYKIQGGHIFSINWHFHNEGGVPEDEDVYLRFKLTCDDADAGYTDTDVLWLDTVLGSEFCVPPGKFVYPNPARYPVSQPMKMVAAAAHVHDHVRSIKLMANDRVLWDYAVPRQEAYSYHFSHLRPCTQHGWHRHPNHLKQKTLSGWMPEDGVIVDGGDFLWVASEYFNDHDTTIDAMAIVVIAVERTE